MSEKDQAIGRLVTLLQQFDAESVQRLIRQVEDTQEIGPWGICHIPQHAAWNRETLPAAFREAYEN